MSALAWIDLTDPSSGQIEAGAVVVQTALVAGGLWYARRQLNAARDVREATERPFVVVELVPGVAHSILDLVITNHGPVIARDVTFEFTPPITSSIVDDLGTSGLLAKGVPTLAPGRVISTLFDSLLHRKAEDHPDAIDVVVSYRGEGARSYVEPMRLDVDIFRRLQFIDRKTTHHLHGELEKLRKATEKMLAGGGNGVLISTRDEVRLEREKWMAEHARGGAAAADDKPIPDWWVTLQ